MSDRNLELAYIEWNPNGKIHTIIKSRIRNAHLNVLDRMAYEVTHQPDLVHFDVEWCERDQIYYYNKSGFGPGPIFLAGSADPKKSRFKFWAAHGLQFTGWNERTQRSRKLTEAQIKKLGYDRIAEVKWTEDITVGNSMYTRPPAEEGECSWCDECQDMLPRDDFCEHTFYCTAEDCSEAHWSQPTHCPDHEICKHYAKSKKKVRS